MDDLQLLNLAVHYVDRKSDQLILASKEQNIGALDRTIVDFFIRLIKKVRDEEDAGPNRSASFLPDDPTLTNPSTAKRYIDAILGNDTKFLNLSRDLANRLYQCSPRTASPGILAIIKFVNLDDGKVFVAFLKIRHKDQSFVRLLESALTQLEVEQVHNLLSETVQKGAIIPHPDREEYELKVIDKQVEDDPAVYFTANFLGCSAKKSDVHQIKQLIPEIIKYSMRKGLHLDIQQIPLVINTLQDEPENITTDSVARVISQKALFGTDFKRNEFVAYINTESKLGPIDISALEFRAKGKDKTKSRMLTYKFADTKYHGLTLTGLSEVFQEIIKTEGDKIVFNLETTKEGLDISYE